MKTLTFLLPLALVVAQVNPAQAVTSLITDRNNFTGTDSIDWGQFGPPGTNLSGDATSTLYGTSADGNGFKLRPSGALTPPERVNSFGDLIGNIIKSTETFTFTFDRLIGNFGTTIGFDFGNNSSNSTIAAYGVDNNLLGSFINFYDTNDGSRTRFIGISDSDNAIKSIKIVNSEEFGLIDTNLSSNATAVPEPPGYLSLIFAAVAAFKIRRHLNTRRSYSDDLKS